MCEKGAGIEICRFFSAGRETEREAERSAFFLDLKSAPSAIIKKKEKERGLWYIKNFRI